MIKQKLQLAWSWTKEKVKKFKKWIIALLIPVALAAPLIIEPILYPVGKITAPENNGYSIGVLNYDAVLASDITDDQPLKYQLDDKFISFKPIEMRWDNNKFKDIKPQKAKINKKNYSYKDAFGEGIDIDMNFGERVFEKIVKVESLVDLGEIPPGTKNLEIVFEVDTNFIIDGWNKKDEFEITDTVRLGDFSYIEPAMVWDSYMEESCEQIPSYDDTDTIIEEYTTECEILENKIQIKSYFEKGKYIKQIPVGWLKTAQYPIYTDADITYGTASEFEDGVTRRIKVNEVDTNKFVTCFNDQTDDNAGKCRAATVSGTTISWGDVVEFAGNIAPPDYDLGLCKLDTDKFAVAYADNADDDGYSIAATISGTTIAFGSASEFLDADVDNVECIPLGTDKYVIIYNNEGGADDLWYTVNTTAGTAISEGTDRETSGVYYENIEGKNDGTDKVVFFHNRVANAGAYVTVATISGDTLTRTSDTSLPEQDTVAKGDVAVLDTDKILVFHRGTNNIYATAGTISTRTITWGTQQTISAETASYPLAVTEVDTTHALGVYTNSGETQDGTSNYLTVDFSDRSISVGDDEDWESGAANYVDTDLISSDKVVICFQDDGDSDKGHCIIGDAGVAPSARRIFIID